MVYMRQPQGFEDKDKPFHVCKLHKALYGLKQAPRAWFDKLRETLLHWGFSHSKADPSLFYFVSSSKVILALIYVDDIIINANKQHFLIEFTQKLHHSFALKDLGLLHFFLGIQVTRTSCGFFLTQAKYDNDLLTRFSMNHVNACLTPMAINLSLSTTEGEPIPNPTDFLIQPGSRNSMDQVSSS